VVPLRALFLVPGPVQPADETEEVAETCSATFGPWTPEALATVTSLFFSAVAGRCPVPAKVQTNRDSDSAASTCSAEMSYPVATVASANRSRSRAAVAASVTSSLGRRSWSFAVYSSTDSR